MSSQSDQRDEEELLVKKLYEKPSDLTLDELAKVLFIFSPNSDPGRAANTEILRRQFLHQEHATEAQERAAEAQESAAKSSKKHTRLMTWSVVILAISALGTFLIAVFG